MILQHFIFCQLCQHVDFLPQGGRPRILVKYSPVYLTLFWEQAKQRPDYDKKEFAEELLYKTFNFEFENENDDD